MAAVDGRAFRRVMGRFATGVTVLTTQVGREMHGMTANALTSVSLDPPLVLICLDGKTHMLGLLRQSGTFAVNVLGEQQAHVSDYFAKRPVPVPEERFVPWECGPRLSSCLAAVACRVETSVEAGDHTVVIGRVVALFEGDPAARPLLFFGGSYGDFRRRGADGTAEDVPLGLGDQRIFYDPGEVP